MLIPAFRNRSPVRSAWCWLTGAAFLMLFGTMQAQAQSSLAAQVSPLVDIVSGLNAAEASARFDFAALAVEALVSAYERELAAVASERPRTNAEQVRLATWRRATEGFLVELRVAHSSLQVAREVTVQMDRLGQIVIMIDGRPLWVIWPRVNTQLDLERALASDFCRRHSCSEAALATSRVPDAAPTVRGNWVFSQGRTPVWQSEDGVRCQFPDLAERAARESACAGVVLGLRALASVLETATALGAVVDWDAVMLEGGAGSSQRIRINQQGEFVEVWAPALAGNEIDWQAAGHWLRLRAAGAGGVTGMAVFRAGFETGRRADR